MFRHLYQLKKLTLEGNPIAYVRKKSFQDMKEMKSLVLSNLSICIIDDYSFYGMDELMDLNLMKNNISYLSEFSFSGLHKLEVLNLKSNMLSQVDLNVFHHLKNLRWLASESEVLCCYASQVSVCLPRKQGNISLCYDLINGLILKCVCWCFGLYTLSMNLITLFYNSKLSHENTQAVLAAAMSATDCLIGFYLTTLSFADAVYYKHFPMVRETWKSGMLCRFLKLLFFVSIQVSIASLLVTAINHYVALCKAMQKEKMKKQTNIFIILGLWLVSALVVLLANTFDSSYASSTLCLPFGTTLAFALLFGLLTLIDISEIIVICYLYFNAVKSVKESSKKFNKTNKHIVTIVTRIILAIVTNVITLLAYISVCLLVVLNYAISEDVVLWIIVFGVTCNAIFNPIHHTFSTSKFLGNFHFICKKRDRPV